MAKKRSSDKIRIEELLSDPCLIVSVKNDSGHYALLAIDWDKKTIKIKRNGIEEIPFFDINLIMKSEYGDDEAE